MEVSNKGVKRMSRTVEGCGREQYYYTTYPDMPTASRASSARPNTAPTTRPIVRPWADKEVIELSSDSCLSDNEDLLPLVKDNNQKKINADLANTLTRTTNVDLAGPSKTLEKRIIDLSIDDRFLENYENMIDLGSRVPSSHFRQANPEDEPQSKSYKMEEDSATISSKRQGLGSRLLSPRDRQANSEDEPQSKSYRMERDISSERQGLEMYTSAPRGGCGTERSSGLQLADRPLDVYRIPRISGLQRATDAQLWPPAFTTGDLYSNTGPSCIQNRQETAINHYSSGYTNFHPHTTFQSPAFRPLEDIYANPMPGPSGLQNRQTPESPSSCCQSANSEDDEPIANDPRPSGSHSLDYSVPGTSDVQSRQAKDFTDTSRSLEEIIRHPLSGHSDAQCRQETEVDRSSSRGRSEKSGNVLANTCKDQTISSTTEENNMNPVLGTSDTQSTSMMDLSNSLPEKQFPWIEKFKNSDAYCTFKKQISLKTLNDSMVLFIRYSTISVIISIRNPDRAASLNRVILHFMDEFHSALKTLGGHENDEILINLVNILSFYLDGLACLSRYNIRASFKLACNAIEKYLDGDAKLALLAVLRCHQIANLPLWNIIFRKYLLQSTKDQSATAGTIHIMAFNVWCNMSKNKDIKDSIKCMALANIRLPSDFVLRCENSKVIPRVLPKVPGKIKNTLSFYMQAKCDYREKIKVFFSLATKPNFSLKMDDKTTLRSQSSDSLAFDKSPNDNSQVIVDLCIDEESQDHDQNHSPNDKPNSSSDILLSMPREEMYTVSENSNAGTFGKLVVRGSINEVIQAVAINSELDNNTSGSNGVSTIEINDLEMAVNQLEQTSYLMANISKNNEAQQISNIVHTSEIFATSVASGSDGGNGIEINELEMVLNQSGQSSNLMLNISQNNEAQKNTNIVNVNTSEIFPTSVTSGSEGGNGIEINELEMVLNQSEQSSNLMLNISQNNEAQLNTNVVHTSEIVPTSNTEISSCISVRNIGQLFFKDTLSSGLFDDCSATMKSKEDIALLFNSNEQRAISTITMSNFIDESAVSDWNDIYESFLRTINNTSPALSKFSNVEFDLINGSVSSQYPQLDSSFNQSNSTLANYMKSLESNGFHSATAVTGNNQIALNSSTDGNMPKISVRPIESLQDHKILSANHQFCENNREPEPSLLSLSSYNKSNNANFYGTKVIENNNSHFKHLENLQYNSSSNNNRFHTKEKSVKKNLSKLNFSQCSIKDTQSSLMIPSSCNIEKLQDSSMPPFSAKAPNFESHKYKSQISYHNQKRHIPTSETFKQCVPIPQNYSLVPVNEKNIASLAKRSLSCLTTNLQPNTSYSEEPQNLSLPKENIPTSYNQICSPAPENYRYITISTNNLQSTSRVSFGESMMSYDNITETAVTSRDQQVAPDPPSKTRSPITNVSIEYEELQSNISYLKSSRMSRNPHSLLNTYRHLEEQRASKVNSSLLSHQPAGYHFLRPCSNVLPDLHGRPIRYDSSSIEKLLKDILDKGLFPLHFLPNRNFDIDFPSVQADYSEGPHYVRAYCSIFGGLYLHVHNESFYVNDGILYIHELSAKYVSEYSTIVNKVNEMVERASSSHKTAKSSKHSETLIKYFKAYKHQKIIMEEILFDHSRNQIHKLIRDMISLLHSIKRCRCVCLKCSANHIAILANNNLIQKLHTLQIIHESLRSRFPPQNGPKSDINRRYEASGEGMALPLKKRCWTANDASDQEGPSYPATRMMSIADLYSGNPYPQNNKQVAHSHRLGTQSRALPPQAQEDLNAFPFQTCNYLVPVSWNNPDTQFLKKYQFDLKSFLFSRLQAIYEC